MNSGTPRDRTSWRGASPALAATAASRGPAWRASTPLTTYRSRWWKLGAVALALFVCLAAVSYAALWLRPLAPARLVVVEAGYDTNLTVPPNATGKAAGRELLALGSESGNFSSRGRLRNSGEPIRLTRTPNLLPELDLVKERTVVLFLAAHGGRDTDGAFLFPDDTTPDPTHRVRLKAVIDRLAKLPAKTNKLLILDATQPPSYPDLGLLHNDFADALEQLDADIAAVPNLVVVSSTGTDERSWISPEWGQTTFGHYFIEGLKGHADTDRDRRLTAWELFEHIRPQVHNWARDHRAALQTPVLLPHADGEHRARGILLATFERDSDEAATPAPTPFEPPAELEQLWKEYRSLTEATTSPISYAPHIWREYQAWILRYEHLLLTGTSEAAEIARAKVSDARRRIEALRRLPVSTQSLALPYGLGGIIESGHRTHDQTPGVAIPNSVFDGLTQLAATSEADRPKVWASIRSSIVNVEPDAVRLVWCAGLVKWVALDPATRLALAPSLISLVAEGMTILPTEVHLLAMLAKHMPAFSKSEAIGPLVGQLLELRSLGEYQFSDDEYSGYALPTRLKEIQLGDEARRKAEDLAFGPTASWSDAIKSAEVAKKHYLFDDDALNVAIRQWLHGAAWAPAFTNWVTHLPASSQNSHVEAIQQHTDELRSLWNLVHDLSREYLKPKGESNPLDRQVTALIVAIEKRVVVERRFNAEIHRLLSTRPEFNAKSETREELVKWWHDADAVLSVPVNFDVELKTDLADRMRLVVELRRVSRQLHVTASAQPKSLSELRASTTKEKAFQTARWLGLIQLSRLGRDAFPGDSFNQLEFRLNNFALQADARAALVDIGAILGRKLNENPTPKSDNPTLDELHQADRRVRIMPAAATVSLGAGPTDALRRRMAANVLLAQAERTYTDHWYGGRVPYYRAAVTQLLADARKITGPDLGDAEKTWAKRLEKDAPFPLTPVVSKQLWLTDEPSLTVNYPLLRTADDPAGPGFAVFWQEPPFPPAKLPEPGSQLPPRIVRATGLPMSSPPAEAITTTLTPPAGPKPDAPTVITGTGKLQGFFRGRLVSSEAAVNYTPVPDKAAVAVPPPAAATLAVRADPTLQAKFGTAVGSIAFVIDCTGSMGPPKDAPLGENGRYPQAVEVMEKLLRAVPTGTTVSVWSFGQRTPDAKSPDDTVREQLPRTVWGPDSSTAVDTLIPTLRGLEPWDESSVMRALLIARNSLRDAPGSFKAVVLVSDAVDNRFAQDAEYNPRKESIKDALKTRFAGTGVRVGIVAIPVTDKTESAAQTQFKAVETMQPAGKFVAPPQAESLIAWLRSGLNPRLRFQVTPVATEAGAPPVFDLAAGDDATDNWYPGRLPQGTYLIRVKTDREYQFPLSLSRGDRLLLRLREDHGNLFAGRVWFAAEAPAIARTPEGNAAGRLALLQNQALDGKALRLLVAVEDKPSDVTIPFAADHIGDVWFELTPSVPKPTPIALRFTNEPGYPSPVWGLDVRGWPTLPDGKTPPAHTLETWWYPDGPFPASARWEASPGEKPLEIPSTRLPVNDNVVSLDSIRLEDHTVAIALGQTALKKCLVVRMSHAPDRPVWVRPVGLTPAGSEVRVFRDANKTTCLFWWPGEPPTEAGINSTLRGFEVVSAQDFKRDSAAAGRYLKLADAPAPSPASARPLPPADVRATD